MTTIAVRDGVMASDSCMSGNFVTDATKLYKKDGRIIGICGHVTQALVFVDWYFDRHQRQPSIANENEWEAIVMSKDGLEYWDASLRPVPIKDKFHAIGSGAELAMGAMEAGKNAKQAVLIACRRDPYSAPPVVTMRL